MNRSHAGCHRLRMAVPHVRGDEPHVNNDAIRFPALFPTCVGMNRWIQDRGINLWSVPHVRGDEPVLDAMEQALENCSPRAWG